MHANNTAYVDTDPWAWHVMHEEKIGARQGRVTVRVYDAVSYWRGPFPVRTHPEHDGRVFDTTAEAVDYMVEHGLVRAERPGDEMRSSPAIKTMAHRDDHEGYRRWLDLLAALHRARSLGEGFPPPPNPPAEEEDGQ